jgi:hypothetical protein
MQPLAVEAVRAKDFRQAFAEALELASADLV